MATKETHERAAELAEELGMRIHADEWPDRFELRMAHLTEGELRAMWRAVAEERERAHGVGIERVPPRVVAMSRDAAKRFLGREDEPIDLGPADGFECRDGAHVFQFPLK